MKKRTSGTDDVENVFEPEFEEQDMAVRVVDLHKKYRNYYRSKIVLNGLNLNCQAGKLYILYGVRKSGKSAVVKSILQIESFSRGAIAIFNKDIAIASSHVPIGYMPQQVGLDTSLTTVETINYFASLQKLNMHDCIKNFSDMQSPITISDYDTSVKHLSEDQKRVLSFYIAIMASPKIVILDQPLAACDPIYKHFIWLKLRAMANEGTTIFMTCSDEADVKYADTVGYLRNGQIIVEESPAELMKRYNIWSFNDLILSITVAELKQVQISEFAQTRTKDNVSIKSGGFDMTHFTTNDDEAESTTKEKIMLDKSFSGHSKKKTCQSCNLQDIVKQLWVLMKWQTKVSVRSYFKLLFHLILPTLCVLFYGYSVGNDMTEVNLGIVCCGIERNESMDLCDFEKKISKKYLSKIDYQSYDEAAKDAQERDLGAILLFNQNASKINIKKKEFGCESSAFETSNIVLEVRSASKLIRSHIIDQLSRAYGGSDENPLMPIKAFSSGFAENPEHCLADCSVTPFLSTFKYHEVGKYESEVIHLIWGAVAAITHFTGAIIGTLPLCTQNRNGLLDRMKMVDVTNYKLQLVHWATRTLFILAQNLMLLVSAISFLEVEFSAYRFFSGWLAITLQTLCGFSFGILLFAILKKPVPIILSLVIFELIVSSLSGFFWNYHGLTRLFQRVSIVFPHQAVSKLLFQVIIHGTSAAYNNIWLGFLSPLFWMISTFVIYCVYKESNQ